MNKVSVFRLVTNGAWHSPSDWTLHWSEVSKESPGLRYNCRSVAELDADTFLNEALESAVLYIPTELTLTVREQVEPAQLRHLLKAAQFELEPYIASDIESMHVARAPVGGNSLELVGVDAAQLHTILAMLEAVGFNPAAVYPDSEGISTVRPEMRILLERDRALLKCGGEMSMTVNLAQIVPMLTQYFRTRASDSLPQLRVFTSENNNEHLKLRDSIHALWLKEGGELVDGNSSSEPGSTAWFEMATAAQPLVNLRQGAFEREDRWTKARLWLPACAGLAAALAIVSASLFTSSAYIQQQRHSVLDQQAQLYQHYYPNARQVFDPPRQLRSKLAASTTPEQSKDGLATFAAFSDVLANESSNSTLSLERVSFSAKTSRLIVQLRVESVEKLESLKQSLNSNGLTAAVEAARDDNGSVVGRLQLDLLSS